CLGLRRIVREQVLGQLARRLDQFGIAVEVGIAQQRHAALARTNELARAADLEVLARDREAVGVLEDDLEPRTPGLRPGLGGDQDGCGFRRAAPPTRPRSWCNCASPKRSACSITIKLALGTSTPTSITVVATSTSSSPAENAAMVADFSAFLSRPWTRPIRSSGSASTSAAKVSCAVCSCSASDSSISGHTQ